VTLAWWAEQCSLCGAALVLAWRARTRPPLRPLACALAAVAALDLAMLAPLPRWAYVGAFAAWYCAQALAVGVGLLAGDDDNERKEQ